MGIIREVGGDRESGAGSRAEKGEITGTWAGRRPRSVSSQANLGRLALGVALRRAVLVEW